MIATDVCKANLTDVRADGVPPEMEIVRCDNGGECQGGLKSFRR